MSRAFTFDFSDFEEGLKELAEQAGPRALEVGMFKAASKLLEDAIEEEPHAPFHVTDKAGNKGGDLWASARIKGSGENLIKRDASPALFSADSEGGASLVTAGFNKEYAARWHEISEDNISTKDKLGRVYSGHWPIRWTWPGAGPKFLESKLYMYKKDYLEIIGKALKKVLASGGK